MTIEFMLSREYNRRYL